MRSHMKSVLRFERGVLKKPNKTLICVSVVYMPCVPAGVKGQRAGLCGIKCLCLLSCRPAPNGSSKTWRFKSCLVRGSKLRMAPRSSWDHCDSSFDLRNQGRKESCILLFCTPPRYEGDPALIFLSITLQNNHPSHKV